MQSRVSIYCFLFTLLMVCGYGVFWLNTAYELRRSSRAMISDIEAGINRRIYYSGIELGGFPFSFNMLIKHLRMKILVDDGAYEFDAGDINLRSDILLRKIKISAGGPKSHNAIIGDDALRVFSSHVDYQPVLSIELYSSLFHQLFSEYSIRKFIFDIKNASYRDDGYRLSDGDGSFIYSNNGHNAVSFSATQTKNKRTGVVERDMSFALDLNVRSEYSPLYVADIHAPSGVPLVMPYRPFHILSHGEFRIMPDDKWGNIYLNLNNLSYSDQDYHASLKGAGGLVTHTGDLIGDFKLEFDNYDKFFNEIVQNMFVDKYKFMLFKNKIIDLADKIENGSLSLTYHADDKHNAKIGKISVRDFSKFMFTLWGPSLDEFLASIKKGARSGGGLRFSD